MASFYHIYLRPKDGVTSDDIKLKMDLAIDWYMYARYCWIVKTTSDEDKWFARLKPLTGPGGLLLIIKIDHEHRQGWMSKDFWKWLRGNE
jgi:hypothetical protein